MVLYPLTNQRMCSEVTTTKNRWTTAILGSFFSAVTIVVTLAAVVLVLAVSRGRTYSLPGLVTATGGTGADLGSMSFNAAGGVVWVAGLSVALTLLGVGLVRGRK
jgi:hypothetical protein